MCIQDLNSPSFLTAVSTVDGEWLVDGLHHVDGLHNVDGRFVRVPIPTMVEGSPTPTCSQPKRHQQNTQEQEEFHG